MSIIFNWNIKCRLWRMLFKSFSEILILLWFTRWFVSNSTTWRIVWRFLIAIFWRNWLRFIGNWRLWIILWFHNLIGSWFFTFFINRLVLIFYSLELLLCIFYFLIHELLKFFVSLCVKPPFFYYFIFFNTMHFSFLI